VGSEQVLENYSWGPGKSWIFLSVKEWELWRRLDGKSWCDYMAMAQSKRL